VEAKLDGVDLDQIEIEAEDRGDEEDEDVTGEDVEEGGTSNDVLVNVLGPETIEKEEWTEHQAGDDDSENGNADETPEMNEALLKQSAEAGGSAGLVAEKSAGD
jgi:hypothetical protein